MQKYKYTASTGYNSDDVKDAKIRKLKKMRSKKIDKIKLDLKKEELKEHLRKVDKQNEKREKKKKEWNSFYHKKYTFFDSDRECRDYYKAKNIYEKLFFDEIEKNFYTHYDNLRDKGEYRENNYIHLPNKKFPKTEKEYGAAIGLKGKIQKSEIKMYWRKALLQWHPDKWVRGTDQERKTAHEKTVLINEAHKFFKDKYGL
jgi:hypothetical protein